MTEPRHELTWDEHDALMEELEGLQELIAALQGQVTGLGLVTGLEVMPFTGFKDGEPV